jgi:type II secretion system protein E
MKRNYFGEMLVQKGILSKAQLESAMVEQQETRERLGAVLLRHGWVTEKDILTTLSEQCNIPLVRLAGENIDHSLAQKIPAKFAYRYKMLPVRRENNCLTVAVTDPMDLHALDDVRLLLQCDIKAVLCHEKEVVKALKEMYGVGAETMEQLSETGQESDGETGTVETGESADDTDDASIIKFVNQIIREAYDDRATDIHIEPFEDDLIVRYRVDGILHEIATPPSIKRFQSAIISRIKIMADMNIAEKRHPQDGRIQFKAGNETIDLRVSSLPILHGESIDLRILPRSQMYLSLEQLGLPEVYLQTIAGLIQKPHGIMLVTGPTGHGKTTTLYACLSRINTPDKKIITVEDPVEYQLKRVNQMPVHHKIGMTFANGLRSILRQDPDVIMVGEIRDQETAEIAIRASLTGHLVFSTLHTNDAAGAITRLVDMGIEPYLVSSSVDAILAQRLVRLVCPKCRQQHTLEYDYIVKNGLAIGDEKPGESVTVYVAGKGCEECRHTGYKGRTGIYELITLDEDLRRLVLEKTSSGVIKKRALSEGMTTLRQDGWRKVRSGATTIDEIMRVTQEEL